MKQILGICLLIGAAAMNLFGQAGVGAMTGLVRDASGAVVPGATVTITNVTKGIKRTTETSSERSL